MEIGANVGTTSIYFKKNILNTLNYICFEPVEINQKYLKVNCILNDCEDIKIEKIGLSNTNGRKNMRIPEGTYGGSSVIPESGNNKVDTTCMFMRLDDYVIKNGILPTDISYIWVDVESHELEVVEGAIETLRNSPAGLYIEVNLSQCRSEKEKTKHFFDILSEIYSKFIVYEQYEMGKTEVRDIKELYFISEEMNFELCNILFMK